MPSRISPLNPSSNLPLSTGGFADSFEGTLIPPPAPEPRAPPPPRQQSLRTPKEVTPPESPSSYSGSRKTSLAGGFGGGLSSHPITPIDTRSTEAFPQQDQPAMSMSTSSTDDATNKPFAKNGYHTTQLSEDSSDSNNFDPSLPQQPVKDTSRRPSFLSRFMRMRSGSVLRKKSSLGQGDSNTSLSQQQQGSRAPSIMAPSERGLKRPGTPTVGGRAPGAPNSNTFPRMMRKKSMELLSTARRKSGMWDRGNTMQQSALQDERAREQAQEDYMDGVESEQERKTSEELERERLEAEDDRRRRFEENIRRDPPPTVQLNGINTSALDGDDMFGSIGK